ncbi:MAG TPA: hypothetical protein VFS89_00980 [Nitrosospira sp.]|nr:hypothetical protein [Nitrosospira sp.]
MANEAIYAWGTVKTLEASGASITNGAIVQANDASYDTVVDGSNYPDAVFVLKLQFATITSIENKVIGLYARPKNIDGANHAPAPTTTFMEKYIGSFTLQAGAVNVDQYLILAAEDLPKEADYYLVNLSGQTVTSGWALKVTPRTYKAA